MVGRCRSRAPAYLRNASIEFATLYRLPLDVNLKCLGVCDHAVQPCDENGYLLWRHTQAPIAKRAT